MVGGERGPAELRANGASQKENPQSQPAGQGEGSEATCNMRAAWAAYAAAPYVELIEAVLLPNPNESCNFGRLTRRNWDVMQPRPNFLGPAHIFES